MRIHTSLNHSDLYDAARAARVGFTTLTEHKSRSHVRAFEIKLTGSSSYRQNFGDDYAATWDEWGIFLAVLFERDADIKTPYYRDRNDFHWQTGERFVSLRHSQQHAQHNWQPFTAMPVGDTENRTTLICKVCDAHQHTVYGYPMPAGYVAPPMTQKALSVL